MYFDEMLKVWTLPTANKYGIYASIGNIQDQVKALRLTVSNAKESEAV